MLEPIHTTSGGSPGATGGTTYVPPLYIPGSGDPTRKRNDYYPWWLDNLADDATGEGAFMQGAAQGADAIRSLVTYARTLYEYQEFNYFGDYGGDRFIEDYTTQIHGEPTGVIVTVTRNAAGDAQHIVVNHRPRSSVLLLTSLCAERFAGTSHGEHLRRRRARPPGRPWARHTWTTPTGPPTTTRSGLTTSPTTSHWRERR